MNTSIATVRALVEAAVQHAEQRSALSTPDANVVVLTFGDTRPGGGGVAITLGEAREFISTVDEFTDLHRLREATAAIHARASLNIDRAVDAAVALDDIVRRAGV